MDKKFCTSLVFLIFIVSYTDAGNYMDDDDDEAAWNRCPWIRNKLKNGRVKIRNRGRIAKFLCDPGFELVGKRFSSCNRGQWSTPVPMCVARGCFKLPDVQNGHVTEMYRGAVMMYDCNPGYTLEGPNTLYCDGRRWSAVVPDCVLAITNPKLSCDFEDPTLCGWTQDPTHDFDWRRNQFSTPSHHAGTGPTFDHTFGPGKGGYYLYQEASSPRKPNDVSRLFSPVYYMDQSGGCFFFWYHMYGSDIGALKIYIKPETHVFGELAPSWEMHGNQGDIWLRGNVSVPNFSEYFQIVIEGVRGPQYIGDTAIDDVYLSTLECDEAGNSTEEIPELRSNSCRGRCREEINSTYCGCNDDCHANGNCCFDFMTICTGNDGSTDPSEEQGLTTTSSTSDSSSSTLPVNITSSPENSTFQTETITELSSSSTTNLIVTSTTQLLTTTSTQTVPTKTSSIETASVEDTSTTVEKTTTKVDETTKVETTSVTPMKASSSSKKAELMTTVTPVTKQTVSSTLLTTSKITTLKTTPLTSTTMSTSSKTNPYIFYTSSTHLETTPKTITQLTTVSTTAGLTTLTERPISSISLAPSTTSHSVSSTESLSTKSTLPIILSSSTSYDSRVFTLLPSPTTLSTKTSTMQTTTLEPMTSTRRTYNLRPRNRTSAVPSFIWTRPYLTSTPTTTTKSSTMRYETIPYSRWHFLTSTTTRPPFRYVTTPFTRRTFFSTTTQRPTTLRTYPTTPRRNTIFYRTMSSTPISRDEKFEIVDGHASKSASRADEKSNSVLIVVIVVIIASLVAFSVYLVRRRAKKNQTKLSDDSEMRFLSENDDVDYSDPTALDKMMTH